MTDAQAWPTELRLHKDRKTLSVTFDGGERFAELGRIASKVPSLVQAERRSRSDFLRGIYREYAGARLADLDAVADAHLTDHILSRLSPDAVRRIREHRAAGHQTVLITGAIRPLTRPLLPPLDDVPAMFARWAERPESVGKILVEV